MAYARVAALNDDAGDALARVVAPAADDVLADAVAGAEAAGGELVAYGVAVTDVVAPAAPSSEHGEAQMNRLHVRSQAPKGERYPAPPGFPGQMGLRLPVAFPGPLAPARQTVVVPPLAASMAATSLPEASHSHRYGVLEIEDYYVPSPHPTNWLERLHLYLPDPLRY